MHFKNGSPTKRYFTKTYIYNHANTLCNLCFCNPQTGKVVKKLVGLISMNGGGEQIRLNSFDIGFCAGPKFSFLE